MPLIFANSHQELLAHSRIAHDDEAGGQVSFIGTVRKHNHGKEVAFLDYEAHEILAQKLFLDLEAEAKKRFGLIKSHAAHRTQRVHIGEPAVFIHALCAHRHEAFSAARFLIDELKKTLPIWRKEVYSDGEFSFAQSACHGEIKLSDAMRAEIYAPAARALLARGVDPHALAEKRVVLVGAGGLGCPLAINLAALNLHLTIVDGDRVSASNLARQYAFRARDIGQHKASLLKQFIHERFGTHKADAVDEFISDDNARDIMHSADLIVDATDDRATKTMLKKLAHRYGWPLISASVHQRDGEVQIYHPAHDACLLCFDHELYGATQSCARIGVLTHVCQMVAAIAAEKTIGIVMGNYDDRPEIVLIDPGNSLLSMRVQKDRHCKNCGEQRRESVKLIPLVRRG